MPTSSLSDSGLPFPKSPNLNWDLRMFVIAHLNDAQLKALRELEDRRGVRVLAFEDMPVEPEPLDEQVLDDVRETEEKTGLTLIAVK